MKLKNNQSGINMIQVLLVVAIFMIIASMAIPSMYQLQSGIRIDSVATEIGQNLRRAQTKAMTGYKDSDWGVYYSANSYTIYSGDSYELRDQTEDEDFIISGSITIVNDFGDEIRFFQNSGLPNVTGLVILSDLSNIQYEISINSQGVIEY